MSWEQNVFHKAVLATDLSLARQDSPFGDRSLGGDFSRSKARADAFLTLEYVQTILKPDGNPDTPLATKYFSSNHEMALEAYL